MALPLLEVDRDPLHQPSPSLELTLSCPHLQLANAVSVRSDQVTTVTVKIAADTSLFAGLKFAGGATGSTASIFSGLSLLNTVAVSFTLSSTQPTALYITVNTPTLLVAGNANVKLAMLAGFNDANTNANANANANANVYGALAVTVDGTSNTYTIPVGYQGPLYLAAIDTTKTQSNTTASAGTTSTSNGAAAFNFNNQFYPVSYASKFELTNGQQYAFGNNILVTPNNGATSGSAGNLNITYIGTFAGSSNGAISSASNAPNVAGGVFNGYYQFAGSSNTNIIQFRLSAAQSANGLFRYANGTTVNTATWLAGTAGKTVSWFKANKEATASAAAGDWQRVSSSASTSSNNGANNVNVFASVNSYSQWTVGADGGAASAIAYSAAVIIALIGLVLA